MIASASPRRFRRTIERVAAEPEVDAVIAIFIPPLVTRAADVAAAVRAASAATAAAGTPLLAVFMAATDAERARARRRRLGAGLRHARGGGARARARRPLRRLAAGGCGRAAGAGRRRP